MSKQAKLQAIRQALEPKKQPIDLTKWTDADLRALLAIQERVGKDVTKCTDAERKTLAELENKYLK